MLAAAAAYDSLLFAPDGTAVAGGGNTVKVIPPVTTETVQPVESAVPINKPFVVDVSPVAAPVDTAEPVPVSSQPVVHMTGGAGGGTGALAAPTATAPTPVDHSRRWLMLGAVALVLVFVLREGQG